jgi:eukaryotic-like serine/threonine-protein kinase
MNPERWQQIDELYHAAREDRAVLDQADPELRREVESLLAQEKGAGFLESPALEVAAQQLAGQDLIGRRIGSYQVLSQLGAGGMGEVYRAKDTKLKREVALKVLPEAFAGDPARMARFQREAEVLASLNHPNIAQIYGIEERALVMELVPGKTLKGPLPIETALEQSSCRY